jgi:hypothetical protein
MPLDGGSLAEEAAKILKIDKTKIKKCTLIKQAVDARKKSDVHYVCTADVEIDNEKRIVSRADKRARLINEKKYVFPNDNPRDDRPIVVGAGPAGLFCALMLAENGHRPILIERGKPVRERMRDVENFWNGGALNIQSNVQFGEGGAGTFSDGKLTTGINDVRCRYVLEEFVKFGAPEDILYLAKPHIGTDRLRGVVENIRMRIIECGGEVRFNTQLTNLIIEDGWISGAAVDADGIKTTINAARIALAIGHSARDTFVMLKERGAQMVRKPFSVGGRIEHKQEMINISQYGKAHEKLGAADYKFAVHLPDDRGVYTFCMCPGGVVVAASSEEGGIVTNGMSYYNRSGENANSALLVEVRPEDLAGDDVLEGVKFQRDIEKRAFDVGGGYHAPAQTVGDFLSGKPSLEARNVFPTYSPAVAWGDVRQVLPEFVADAMAQAIPLIDRKMRGFAAGEAVITVPETRSSSPIRIVRDEARQSNIRGLFPCGEGAGYAGGIMSAAVDGIRTAEAMVRKEKLD